MPRRRDITSRATLGGRGGREYPGAVRVVIIAVLAWRPATSSVRISGLVVVWPGECHVVGDQGALHHYSR
jgi:hypothetical protein